MEGKSTAVALRSFILTATGWKRTVDLLHDLCEVRAGVMRGRQQLLCRCAADTKNNRRSQIHVRSSIKTQLRGRKCQYWPLNIRVKIVSLQRIILGGNSKITFALISGNRILHN